MREMLSSEQTSLVQLALSNAKHQAQATLLTSAVGRKKPNSKQSITRKQEDLKKRDEVLAALLIKARGKSIADSYLVLRLGDVFGG
jgi:hypothetical protein